MGDFNHDGKADIALTGSSTWASVPVAFSNGDGTFDVTSQPIDFATWASSVPSLTGDFNGDHRPTWCTGRPWHFIPSAGFFHLYSSISTCTSRRCSWSKRR